MIIGVTRKRFWLAVVVGLSVLYYTIKQADLQRLTQNIGNFDPFWGIVLLVASAGSYFCIAAVLHRLLQGIGYPLPFSSSFQISLLSCTLNYLMAVGGVSGVAAKVYLLSRKNIPPSKTLSISMVHGFLTNTVAVIFIYLGFFFLYSGYKMSSREKDIGVFILSIAFLLTWITVQTIVHEAFRRHLWRFLMKTATVASRLLRRPEWIRRERASVFFENFNESMNLLVRRRGILLAPASLALLDWTLMLICLKCSFLAVHYPIDNRSLLVGFSVGIFATIFSLTPASIGLMEGSMAGSFYLMGIDYEGALLATLIYRFAYFFLPILVSLFFYRQFFPTTPQKAESRTRSSP